MTIQMSNPETAPAGTRQEQRDAYWQGLLRTVKAGVPEALALGELQSQAEAIAREHTFPSTQQEEWRFTDLAPMLAKSFQIPTVPSEVELVLPAAVQLSEAAARVVLVNGRFAPTLSDIDTLPEGVVVGSLADLLHGPLSEFLTARLAQAAGSHELFTALNTVGFPDAAVVWASRDRALDQPIQIVYLSIPDATPSVICSRCLVVAEVGSALTVVEDFWGTGEQAQFSNSVTEIWADAAARVTHVRLQREGAGTFHVGKTAVTQGQDSQFTSTAITLGAQISRHNLEVYQTGPQTDTTLQGLTAIANTQLADTHSLIALNHPHGTADQLHKCILAEASRAVFNGRVWVPRTAQLTNASQLNRNLLLSNQARVDTKPELDIVADNVKCAHGATVSQLAASEVFYLQSRGIPAAAAQQLLVYGFALDIIERIPVSSLKDQLTETVTRWAL